MVLQTQQYQDYCYRWKDGVKRQRGGFRSYAEVRPCSPAYAVRTRPGNRMLPDLFEIEKGILWPVDSGAGDL
jgi:hypothetical protein